MMNIITRVFNYILNKQRKFNYENFVWLHWFKQTQKSLQKKITTLQFSMLLTYINTIKYIPKTHFVTRTFVIFPKRCWATHKAFSNYGAIVKPCIFWKIIAILILISWMQCIIVDRSSFRTVWYTSLPQSKA